MKTILSALALGTAFIASGAVSAATIDLTTAVGGGMNVGTDEVYTAPGVEVTATFFANVDLTDGTGGNAVNGQQGASGLGVRPANNSVNRGEAIKFALDTTSPTTVAQLNSVSLIETPNRTGDARIDIYLDGVFDQQVFIGNSVTTILFGSLVSEVMLLNVDGFDPQNLFRVTAIDVSAVPLPGAALLFGSALAAAGVARRRKVANNA